MASINAEGRGSPPGPSRVRLTCVCVPKRKAAMTFSRALLSVSPGCGSRACDPPPHDWEEAANRRSRQTPIMVIDMTDVTFSPQQLQQVIAEAVAQALAARDAKPVPANRLVDGKTENQLKLEVLTVRAFKKAGFGTVTPRVDCQTYNRWLAAGWRVKPGEKAVRVKQLRLFHSSQVERVAPPAKADMRAEGEAAVADAAKPTTVVQSIAAKLKGKGGNPSQPSLV